MYNRYVAQSDGSFLKTRVQEPPGRSGSSTESFSPPCHRLSPPREKTSASIGSFFKNLLPRDLDTEDLIVILLLLLLSKDSSKNGNRALFTLGAYLFL